MNVFRLPTIANAKKALAEAEEAVKRACMRVNQGIHGAEAELDAAYEETARAAAELGRARKRGS